MSHFLLGTRHCNLPEIGEEIMQQLNRNLASRAKISQEILNDYRKHLNENLRMNFKNSPLYISVVIDNRVCLRTLIIKIIVKKPIATVAFVLRERPQLSQQI